MGPGLRWSCVCWQADVWVQEGVCCGPDLLFCGPKALDLWSMWTRSMERRDRGVA